MAEAQSTRPRVYLIDGYSNIFRAYYAIRNLSNRKGEATNAVFGFFQMLRKLLRDDRPAYIGVALDVSSKTVRSDRYEEYKANRSPMPEDLRPQIPYIRRLLEAYKIPILEVPRYEADDVLGTLAKKGSDAGFDIVLASPDKDLMQLVGDGVYQHHTGRDKLYDIEGVTEDFGVPPHQVVDVLALMGDSSDNVPGVKGIGEKGAKKLISEHGSLETLLEAAETIKRKAYREGLINHREDALLSKELVTIHTDLDIEFEPDALRHEEPDWQALLELCGELDFDSIAKELEAEHGTGIEPIEPAIELDDVAAFEQAAAQLRGDVYVAMVGASGSEVGFVMAQEDGDELAHYVDFRRDEALRSAVLDRLAAWVADAAVTLVGHDLKETLRPLAAENRFHQQCRLVDGMLVSYLLMPALRGHSLDDVAFERLRHTPMNNIDAGWGKGMEPLIGDDRLLRYAAERVVLPRRLLPKMRDELADDGKLEWVYNEIEEPLLGVLLTMEELGIVLDRDFLADMAKSLHTELSEIEEKIYVIADERFNINSPRQLGSIMFEKLGYPVLRRTRKTRSWSTDAETLEGLAARGYPLPEELIRFREISKLLGTYVEALPQLVAEDGRLHTRFNQAVAATGRLSSANPNLQNIPIRTEAGQRIRKAFRAPDSRCLVVADYSQIELRVLAHIAEEDAMIDAFKRGEDIHATTAAAIFGGSPLLVTPDQRRMAKTINFGILYGMSSWGLAGRLGIAKNEAQKFIDTYLAQYAAVATYVEDTVAQVLETGRVETLYGRIRWLPDIKSRNWNLREQAKRMAINARIQGTAADILKLGMIAVDRRLRAEHPDARLLLTVHDELVIEAPVDVSEPVSVIVREEMEGAAELAVPLKVDLGVGETWYEAKE
ncbi:MAG: DNA polymerase I [Acidobacteriota bacterium]